MLSRSIKNSPSFKILQQKVAKFSTKESSDTKIWLNKARTLNYESKILLEGEENYVDGRERHYLNRVVTDILRDVPVSPWHDIPLKEEGAELDVFNAVIEITRNTTAKMEVETTSKFNPIVQDQKKNAEGLKIPRHYGLIPGFNYGMIPQTWENSQHIHQETGLIGDNDPLDVVDLTSRDMHLYEMPQLKIIGCLCLID